MKKLLKLGQVCLLLTLALGFFAFTPKESVAKNQVEEVSACYILKADLTTAKWNEIAGPHGYTQYFVIDGVGTTGSTINKSDFKGDWNALMSCLGLPNATLSIVVDDLVDGI